MNGPALSMQTAMAIAGMGDEILLWLIMVGCIV